MSVLEAGDSGRPAIILLHGLGTGARAWQPQMDALGIPGSHFEIVPNAGHVANLDNPEAFTSALRRFLNDV